jgi:hypothetical protein
VTLWIAPAVAYSAGACAAATRLDGAARHQ